MKKKHVLKAIAILAAIHLTSCSNILFESLENGQDKIILSEGKWLVNELKSENSTKPADQYNESIIKGLNKMGITSTTFYASSTVKQTLNKEIPFMPDQHILRSVSENSDFRYLLCLKINVLESSSGGIAFGEQDLENRVTVALALFDIKSGLLVYNLETSATELWPMNDTLEEEPARFSFTRSTENLIKNAINSSLKELRKRAG